MTADVIQFRDWDWLRVPDGEPRGPAEVVILPVVRVERAVAEMCAETLRRHVRRSLLGGDPA